MAMNLQVREFNGKILILALYAIDSGELYISVDTIEGIQIKRLLNPTS